MPCPSGSGGTRSCGRERRDKCLVSAITLPQRSQNDNIWQGTLTYSGPQGITQRLDMHQANSFYFNCVNCNAISSQRYHIKDGELCRNCYQMFTRITTEPLATLTVESLQDLQRKKMAATVKSDMASVQSPVPPNADMSKLSAIENLQFKKYIRENSGMSATEVEDYLKSVVTEERAELISAFRQAQGQGASTAGADSQGSTLMAVPPPVSVSPSISPAAVSVHVLTEKANQPACPKCRSTKTTFNRQGFGVGKAAVGAVLTGGIGLLAGGIGFNKIKLTCLECGHSWTKG